MPSLAQTFLKLPTRSKIVLGAGALAVVFVLFFTLRLASAPSYTPLVSALDPADTG
jgi:flagellar M-ring protein FliF